MQTIGAPNEALISETGLNLILSLDLAGHGLRGESTADMSARSAQMMPQQMLRPKMHIIAENKGDL